jgi:isoquinoline 1-oxidoreductase alpha subunit
VGQVHQDVLTIEGLPEAHPVKVAWVKAQVPQCGYCQSGQIMQAAALLEKMGKPTEAEIKAGMRGILCRCGTYPRILKAMLQASGQGAA